MQAEINEAEAEEKIPFREAINKLFHNKYWVIILIVNLLSNIIYGLANSSVHIIVSGSMEMTIL